MELERGINIVKEMEEKTGMRARKIRTYLLISLTSCSAFSSNLVKNSLHFQLFSSSPSSIILIRLWTFSFLILFSHIICVIFSRENSNNLSLLNFSTVNIRGNYSWLSLRWCPTSLCVLTLPSLTNCGREFSVKYLNCNEVSRYLI